MTSPNLKLWEQQQAWMSKNSRSNPASEGEFLEREFALGHLSVKGRWRVLGMFTLYHRGDEISETELLASPQLNNVTVLGIVSTLLGQPGLHSQCLWYKSEKYDWFWAQIQKVERVEYRTDPRFRGGVPCIWLITPIAEYAMTAPHPAYRDKWTEVSNTFQAAPLDAWPMHGYRPDWWPAQSSREWPYLRHEGEDVRSMSQENELRQLSKLLSAQQISTRSAWPRLGPSGDQRIPGQRLHNLNQLRGWDLVFDSGLKLTQRRLDDDARPVSVEEDGPVDEGKGKKRSWVLRNSRKKRVKLQDR